MTDKDLNSMFNEKDYIPDSVVKQLTPLLEKDPTALNIEEISILKARRGYLSKEAIERFSLEVKETKKVEVKKNK